MANPPITIGPFTNVPAPGSPIRSDWPQSISNYVVSKFTTADATLVQTGNIVVTTDASGIAWHNWPIPFSGVPIVVVSLGDFTNAARYFLGYTITATYGSWLVQNYVGAAIPNAGTRIFYHAIGPR